MAATGTADECEASAETPSGKPPAPKRLNQKRTPAAMKSKPAIKEEDDVGVARKGSSKAAAGKGRKPAAASKKKQVASSSDEDEIQQSSEEDVTEESDVRSKQAASRDQRGGERGWVFVCLTC